MVVRFSQVPEGWRVATPLASMPEGRFSAESYDRLVDSPVEIGTFQESDFDEGGGHYRVIVDAESGDYDMEKIAAMLHKIVAAATSWMEDRPFDNYMFLYHFPARTGGRRHGALLLDRNLCECRCAGAGSRRTGFGDGARVFSSVEREAHSSADARAGGLHAARITRERFGSAKDAPAQRPTSSSCAAGCSRSATSSSELASGIAELEAASSAPDAVGGRVKSGCVAGGRRVLPAPGAQHFLLQQRRVVGHHARFGGARGQPWAGLPARGLSMDESELCKEGPVFPRFGRRARGCRGGEPCGSGMVFREVCFGYGGDSLE